MNCYKNYFEHLIFLIKRFVLNSELIIYVDLCVDHLWVSVPSFRILLINYITIFCVCILNNSVYNLHRLKHTLLTVNTIFID